MSAQIGFGNKFDLGPGPDNARRIGAWLLVAALWLFTLGTVVLFLANR